MASVLGKTSAKTRIRTVMAVVVTTTVRAPKVSCRSNVASEDTRMLMKVLPRGRERIDVACSARAFLFELMHEAARDRCERRFRTGKETRYQQEEYDASDFNCEYASHELCLTIHPSL